jgi:hypothetical protein
MLVAFVALRPNICSLCAKPVSTNTPTPSAHPRFILAPPLPSNMSNIVVPVVLGSTVVWLAIKTMAIGKRELYLPPGPPTAPLLGNLHEFPKTEAHLKYVVHRSSFGRELAFFEPYLNSPFSIGSLNGLASMAESTP